MFDSKKSGLRRQTLLLVSIVILLAMIASFTLAWFSQLLTARGNRMESGSAMGEFVELWAQSAEPEANGGRYGTTFAEIAFPTDETETDVYLAPEMFEDALMQASYKQIQPGKLYKLVKAVREGEDALVYGNKDAGEYNRLLDDEYLLPGKTITRRLIVRNLSEQPLSYTVSFADFAEEAEFQELSEAILVKTTRITEEAPDGKPDLALTGISAAKLKETTVSGELSGGKYDVYELSFTFAGTATDYYAAKSLSLDVKVVANGGKTTHYISTEEELVKLLGTDGGLQHGETIALNQDITLHSDFVTDRMINLDLRGFTLKVEGIFLIDVTKAADYDPAQSFGTIDIAYDGNGTFLVGNGLTGDSKAVGVRAPEAAVRWIHRTAANGDVICTMPDLDTNVDARVFNGVSARNPKAVMPSSTPVDNIEIDLGMNLTFLEGEASKDTLSFVAEAAKASPDDADPTFYATSTDESVAVVESVEQPYTPSVSAYGVGDAKAHARITLRRVSNDASKSCKILVRAGSASAEVIVNVGVGVESFTLPETGFVQPNPSSGPENEISLEASGFLPENAVTETKTIVKWESSDKSLAIVIPDGSDMNKAAVKPAFTVNDVDKIGKTVTVTAISLNGTRQSCEVTLGRKATSVTLSATSLTLSPKAASGASAGSVGGANDTFDLASALAVGPEDASRKDVTWSSSDPSVATVDENGLVSAAISLADYSKFGSTCTITATANDGSGKSADCSVTVGVPVGTIGTTLSECTINPKGKGTNPALNSTAIGLVLNPVAVFAANGIAEDEPAVWLETDASGTPVAEGAKKLTLAPDASKNNEQCAVSAKSEAIGDTAYLKAVLNGMETPVCTIHIGKNVSTVSLAANPTTIHTQTSTNAAKSTTITATVSPADCTAREVTWSISAASGAALGAQTSTVDSQGKATVTLNNATLPGTYTVTGTIDGKSNTCTVTVVQEVTGITVSRTSGADSGWSGETAQLSADVQPTNANNRNVTWSTSNENIASVNTSGLVTFGSTAGDVTITATAQDSSGKTGSYSVTSKGVKVNSITATMPTVVVGKDASNAVVATTGSKTGTLAANVGPQNASNKGVTWSSSNENVVKITNASTGAYQVVDAGTATLTATAADGSGYKNTFTFTVGTQAVQSIALSTTSGSLDTNGTVTLTPSFTPATAYDRSFTLSSSATDVATVSNNIVTAKGTGIATITAKSTNGSKTATYTLTVNPLSTGKAVGDTVMHDGVQWLVVNKSGNNFALLYHDSRAKLKDPDTGNDWQWAASSDTTPCEITTDKLKRAIQKQVNASFTGNVYLPNMAQLGGDPAAEDDGGNYLNTPGTTWQYFAGGNTDAKAKRLTAILDFSSDSSYAWTSTPHAMHSGDVWRVNRTNSGGFVWNSKTRSCGAVPAVNVNL